MRNILFAILVLSCSWSFGQESKTDSLWGVWKTRSLNDTVRLGALDRLSKTLRSTQPDSAYKLAELQRRFAKNHDLPYYVGRALNTKGVTSFFMGNTDGAETYFEKALSVFQKIQRRRDVVDTYANLANIAGFKGEREKEVQINKECLKAFIEMNDSAGMARCYSNMAEAQRRLGAYAESLESLRKAHRIDQIRGDLSSLAQYEVGFALVATNQDEYDEARQHYAKAIEIMDAEGDVRGVAAVYVNLGLLELEEGNIDTSLALSTRAMKMYQELGDPYRASLAMNNVGLAHKRNEDYELALEYYQMSYAVKDSVGNERDKASSLGNIGNVLARMGKPEEALSYAEKGLKKAEDTKAMDLIVSISKILYEIHKDLGNTSMALQMYEKYVETKEDLKSEENQRALFKEQYRYDYAVKAATDSVINAEEIKLRDEREARKDAEISAQKSDIKRQKFEQYVLFGGLGLLMVFALFMINRYRVILRQKQVIQDQQVTIVESINYSQKIQRAMLPGQHELQESLQDIFVFYRPKDIVSGDFYWHKRFEQYTVLACVDCTGHGVPGGFMSMMGSLLLDKVVNDPSTSPALILKRLSDEVILKLHQEKGGDLQDGMDLSICLIDHHTGQLSFSGARNGIIVVQGGEATRYKADLYPVGGNYMKKGKPIDRKFTVHNVSLERGAWVFMYTDGFMEQPNATTQMPMTYGEFQGYLIQAVDKEQPQNYLSGKLADWSGDQAQVDDVLVMGFRVT